jgi:hypothetical protein
MNKYNTSSGERVSDATIKRRLSETYRRLYPDGTPRCMGCGGMAQGSAHIVPKKRCKDIGKADYIWLPLNIIPTCHVCNSVIESYKSLAFQKLRCKELVLEVTEKLDPERYLLMI